MKSHLLFLCSIVIQIDILFRNLLFLWQIGICQPPLFSTALLGFYYKIIFGVNPVNPVDPVICVLLFLFLILNYFSFLFVKPILFFRQDIQVCGKVGKRLSVQFPYYLSVSGIFVKRLVYRDYGNG